MILVVSGNSGFAERHQHFSVGTELADDVPGLHAGLGGRGHGVFGGRVRRPHIAVAVHMHPVRPNEHLGAKAFDDVALRIELVDRVVRLELAVGIHAVETEPTAPCGRHRAGLVASDQGPDALSVDVDVHRSRRSHLAAARKLCPFTSRSARAASIRQSPHRAVWIVGRRLGEARHAGGKQHHDAAQRHPSNSICLRHDTPPCGQSRRELICVGVAWKPCRSDDVVASHSDQNGYQISTLARLATWALSPVATTWYSAPGNLNAYIPAASVLPVARTL